MKQFNDRWHQFYAKCEILIETPTFEAMKSALQYFVFYLSDYFFDLALDGVNKTLLNLFGCCAAMAGYSFALDSLPQIFSYLRIRRELHLSLVAEKFAPESLNENYVHLAQDEEVENREYTLLGDLLGEVLEKSVDGVTPGVMDEEPNELVEEGVLVEAEDSTASLPLSSDSDEEWVSLDRGSSIVPSGLRDDLTAPLLGAPTTNNTILAGSAGLIRVFSNVYSAVVKDNASTSAKDTERKEIEKAPPTVNVITANLITKL